MKGKMLLVLALPIVLFLSLQYALWAGKQNAVDLIQVRDQLDSLNNENRVLERRNRRLHADIVDIKHRLGAIESQARFELGLIKRGETYYQIVRPNANKVP